MLSGRNYLRGSLGHTINSPMAGDGQNPRKIPRKLRLLFAWPFAAVSRPRNAQSKLNVPANSGLQSSP